MKKDIRHRKIAIADMKIDVCNRKIAIADRKFAIRHINYYIFLHQLLYGGYQFPIGVQKHSCSK